MTYNHIIDQAFKNNLLMFAFTNNLYDVVKYITFCENADIDMVYYTIKDRFSGSTVGDYLVFSDPDDVTLFCMKFGGQPVRGDLYAQLTLWDTVIVRGTL